MVLSFLFSLCLVLISSFLDFLVALVFLLYGFLSFISFDSCLICSKFSFYISFLAIKALNFTFLIAHVYIYFNLSITFCLLCVFITFPQLLISVFHLYSCCYMVTSFRLYIRSLLLLLRRHTRQLDTQVF